MKDVEQEYDDFFDKIEKKQRKMTLAERIELIRLTLNLNKEWRVPAKVSLGEIVTILRGHIDKHLKRIKK